MFGSFQLESIITPNPKYAKDSIWNKELLKVDWGL
jgi:hypothetical protein